MNSNSVFAQSSLHHSNYV